MAQGLWALGGGGQKKESIMHSEEEESDEHRSLIPRSDKKALFTLLSSALALSL